MAGEGGGDQRVAGNLVRIAGVAPNAGDDLGANALDRLGVEARAGERKSRRRTASARLSTSVFIEPVKASRPASKESSTAFSSSADWKAWLSRSPAPSSSRPDSILATPGLPAGSCAAPPSKANDIAISGSVWSSTSHASMPCGLTTRWMLLASAVSGAATKRKSKDRKRSGVTLKSLHERTSAGAPTR